METFSWAAAGLIQPLLQRVNESNCDLAVGELCEYADYGNEVCTLLLRACLNEVILKNVDIQQPKRQLFAAVIRHMMDRPNFSSCLCEALKNVPVSEGFLENLSKALGMSLPEKIGISLALSDSENLDLKMRGQSFCLSQIEELCSNHFSVLSNEQIQDVIMFLYRTEGLAKHMDSFTKYLSLLPLKNNTFFLPLPFLKGDGGSVNYSRHLDLFSGSANDHFDDVLAEIEREMSMADVVSELGYGCTQNTSVCIEMLSQFVPLTEVTIAKLLGAMACSRTGLEDSQSIYASFCSAMGNSLNSDSASLNSWNVDVLVDSIKQLAPKINWTLVVQNLDHDGFIISDETAFSLLTSVYNKACQDPFPLHSICGSVWKNAEGQLSFLRHAVSAPPEVFTFAHSPRQLTSGDFANFKHGNCAWLCLDLLEVLCQLAERGHATLVHKMLDYPLNHCPEVLLLGVSYFNTAYNLIQYEVFSTVFPLVLKDSSRRSLIHHLWRINSDLVLRGFIDVHDDPTNLLRILDICQDMKILTSVLDRSPFQFSIKLAAVASKEQINLENWLSDNLSTHKDAFLKECVKFLKGVVDCTSNGISNDLVQQPQSAIINAYQEACPIFFKVLQSQSSEIIPHDQLEEIKNLHFSSESMTQSRVTEASSSSEAIPEDIEGEANAYFHQMFSGQITIDALVKMLARFKESHEKREQMIFECIIRNLFEEYKFFPKYPDRQLKLVAILFGLLIKHQLITHLALGIALRGVLDSLRKSVDSKMFMFGTKALEQFTDRLVEWPQYCNHILQISHLRASHPELVSFIECALARISSSQSETSIGNSIPADQQQVSGTSGTESMEASESSWHLMSSTSAQLGQQLSSLQLHQRGLLGERLKPSTPSVNITKPLLSHSAQSSFVSGSVDSTTSQKPLQPASSQHSVSGTTALLSSPGFLRSRSAGPAGMMRQTSHTTGFGAALNIETLVAAAERRDTPIEAPSPEIQDKILFMINNISTTNMDSKSKEFNEILNEQYFPWFAQYMVMKRASIEPNFHDLYLKFLDRIDSKSLNSEIVKATYENCKVLLRSDLIKSSSEERSLLKNLGSWLGKFTIGRNQALRAKELDPKSLIIEAYEKGLMIAVIPFTSKVLEPCQSSLAYQPPNPWTMAILSLLAEIYNLPNLKMNLKFDIEVLFKNLGVDMKEVKPTSLLKDKLREIEGNPDFSNKDITAVPAQVILDVNSGIIPTLNHVEPEVNNSSHPASHPNMLAQYTTPLNLNSSTIMEDDKAGSLNIPDRVASGHGISQITPPSPSPLLSPSPSPSLSPLQSPSPSPTPSPFSLNQLLNSIPNADSYVNINPKLISMGSQLQFHRIIIAAIDRAIKDIVSPVIQRSVTIASRTTKELVLKDYDMETDDTVISRAAHLMVGTLAGSLAHVTCKEPLRQSLSGHLRSLIQTLNVPADRIDQIVQILTNDHLDLGCALIENVASEKAVELIDGEIAPAYSALRKQREASGSAYYDASSFGQGPFSHLPEALYPKPGRLSLAQQRVYDDFVKNIWQNQSNQSSTAAPAGPPGVSGNSSAASLSCMYGSSSSALFSSNSYPTSQVAPFSSQPLDLISEESERGMGQLLSVSTSNVSPNDGLIQYAGDISSLVSPPSTVVTSSELHLLDPSAELGSVVSPSPGPPADRLVNSLLSTGDVLEKYQQLAQKLEALIAKDSNDAEIQGVVSEVPDMLVRSVSRDEAALAVAQKAFKSLYENASNNLHVVSHLAILAAIRDVCKLVVKELTSWVIYSDEDRKFNKEITVGLIRSELLNLAEYNVHLAKLVDGGRNKAATDFAISLVQTLLVQESGVSVSELYNLVDALAKLAIRPGSPESLQQLIEVARNSVNSPPILNAKEDKARQFRDKKLLSGRSLTNKEELSFNEPATADSTGFKDQVTAYFTDWCRIYDLPATSESTLSNYIAQLLQNGFLKGDDTTERFFRVLTELAVSQCLSVSEQGNTPTTLTVQQLQQLSFAPIDSYGKLVVLVLKYFLVDQGATRASLLQKIFLATIKVINKDAEDKKLAFNPRPYFRLFVNWLLDLTSPDIADNANFQVLTYFANAFHALQPLKVPGWSFAWLELVSHRSFMPKLLTCNSPKGWPHFQRLLVDLFKFMEPYLRNVELTDPIQFLYKGTLRVLLVLLHDFPEFLCDYHFSFCDVIPPSCIQMRNVILSAFPRNMRLPDPSTPNLKIDLLAEMILSPRILSDVEGALKVKQIKAEIDDYIKNKPEGSSFLTDLKQKLLLPQSEANLAGTRYNVPLINSLVLYVGMQAIQLAQNKSNQLSPTQQVAHSPTFDILQVSAAMEIFQSLIKNLDTEGRYLFLNAIANQLRYPNNHTHYFSYILLCLFAEANQEMIQEQITRVLLERLIVNRPHPWGLLITFIELIKNPRYNFWSRSFTRCAPEIEKLFESVSRSCGGPKAMDDGMVSGGIPDGNH